eukprot:1978066-Prymnesium_polylepis.1
MYSTSTMHLEHFCGMVRALRVCVLTGYEEAAHEHGARVRDARRIATCPIMRNFFFSHEGQQTSTRLNAQWL